MKRIANIVTVALSIVLLASVLPAVALDFDISIEPEFTANNSAENLPNLHLTSSIFSHISNDAITQLINIDHNQRGLNASIPDTTSTRNRKDEIVATLALNPLAPSFSPAPTPTPSPKPTIAPLPTSPSSAAPAPTRKPAAATAPKRKPTVTATPKRKPAAVETFSKTATLGQLQVATYNVGSSNSKRKAVVADKVVREIRAHRGPAIWGLVEVNGQDDLDQFTQAMGTNFRSVLGKTGGNQKLAIAYDTKQLKPMEEFENVSGSSGSRSPLVAKFKSLANGSEFLFMVNHFNRRYEVRRNRQADFVRNWANEQTLPTVIVGEFNFDYDINSSQGNETFNKLAQDDVLAWLKPDCLADNDCSNAGTLCGEEFDKISDAVLVSGDAKTWSGKSTILLLDCSKSTQGLPNHRIVQGDFTIK